MKQLFKLLTCQKQVLRPPTTRTMPVSPPHNNQAFSISHRHSQSLLTPCQEESHHADLLIKSTAWHASRHEQHVQGKQTYSNSWDFTPDAVPVTTLPINPRLDQHY